MKKIFFIAAMAATLSANASTNCTQAPDPTDEQDPSIDVYPDDYANPEVGPGAKACTWDEDFD